MCAFKAGSVPVYMGAPNVDEFLPGKKSVIKTSILSPTFASGILSHLLTSSGDFKGPKELAEYLEDIMYSYRYNEYLAWKDGPLAPSFKKARVRKAELKRPWWEYQYQNDEGGRDAS